ncbi:FxsA family protein [Arhodomonas sp. AD133]|uniref:FxsA family protein n=1 Tax=Arhodomonas sp. AD133 TaxID=3415009 RepID=UPI003EC07095
MPVLFLLFVVVPLVEIYLLIQVGQVIGALPTIALCVLTAIIGGQLLRQQGLATLSRARANMDRGSLPAMELLEGIALAVGGALLLTPGFFTDAIGFACLIPYSRQYLIRHVLRHVKVSYGPAGGPPGGHGGRDDAIEGEYHRRDRGPDS